MMTLGERIKSARTKANLTQKELGKLLGATDASINRYEKDLRKPDPETLRTLSGILNVSIDWLVGNNKINILNIFEDNNIKLLAGERILTQEERLRILELLKEKPNVIQPKTFYKIPEQVSADAQYGYGVGEAPSIELIELIKTLANDVIEEREKRNRQKLRREKTTD